MGVGGSTGREELVLAVVLSSALGRLLLSFVLLFAAVAVSFVLLPAAGAVSSASISPASTSLPQ